MREPKDFPADMRIQLFDSEFILIPFTRDEWDTLHWALSALTMTHGQSWTKEELRGALNILDRIEKEL